MKMSRKEQDELGLKARATVREHCAPPNPAEDFERVKRLIHRNATLQLHILSVLSIIGSGTHYEIHASSPRSTELTLTQVAGSCVVLAKKGLIKFEEKKHRHDDREYSLTDLGRKALEP